MLCYVISFGPKETDNNNRMITLTEQTLGLVDCKKATRVWEVLGKLITVSTQ